MSAAQIAGAYALAVGYLACLLGPVWLFGDTLLWVAEQRRAHQASRSSEVAA